VDGSSILEEIWDDVEIQVGFGFKINWIATGN
jgi:hypothetical protein